MSEVFQAERSLDDGEAYWKHPGTANCVPCPAFLPQDSVEHCIIGVTILSQLTNEINQVSATAFLSEVSVQFSHSYCCVLLCVCALFGVFFGGEGMLCGWCFGFLFGFGFFFIIIIFTQSLTVMVRCWNLLSWGIVLFHWHLSSSPIFGCNLLRWKRKVQC